MVETDGAFRTTDLTLAVVLAAAGYRYDLERLNSRKIAWVFDCPLRERKAEEFDDLVAAYDEHSCKVEPRSFVEEMARVRSQMYEKLGITPISRRRPASSADRT